MHSEITRADNMLEWFKETRFEKLTSYATICKYHCLMRDMKNVVQELVDTGKIRKLKHGYKLNRE